MANLDISAKLGHEKQEITISEGKTFEVDCSAEAMLKAQDIFKKDDGLNGLYSAIELLLGSKAKEEIIAMKLTVNELKVILIAIMAQVNEISYEDMEKRFQGQ